MSDLQYRKQSHATYDCRYHIVWIPKYRYDMLEGEVADFVKQVLEQVCRWKEIVMLQGKLRPDHVHLYLSIPPKYSVSDAVKWLKERSATQAMKRFPAIRKRLWGGHFWAWGYFASTVGITDEIIRRYIDNQEKQEQIEEELNKQQTLWQ